MSAAASNHQSKIYSFSKKNGRTRGGKLLPSPGLLLWLCSLLRDCSLGTPGSSKVKDPPSQGRRRRDMGSIPETGRSPGEGNGYPLQCSCLENPMDRWAWRAPVHGITESDVMERLTCTHIHLVSWVSSDEGQVLGKWKLLSKWSIQPDRIVFMTNWICLVLKLN